MKKYEVFAIWDNGSDFAVEFEAESKEQTIEVFKEYLGTEFEDIRYYEVEEIDG